MVRRSPGLCVLYQKWRGRGSAGSECSVSSRVTLSPSALRTTRLVYPGSLNPIAGCAQDHSHGESHPSTHSHAGPCGRFAVLASRSANLTPSAQAHSPPLRRLRKFREKAGRATTKPPRSCPRHLPTHKEKHTVEQLPAGLIPLRYVLYSARQQGLRPLPL